MPVQGSLSELAGLTLFPATPEQKIESRKRSYFCWARGLTEEQYLARDSQLDREDHAIDGRMTTWVLAPRVDPTTLDFKCACETYRRRALIKKPGSQSIEEVFGYAIASVFAPPQNRGKGYGRHMMCLLHWVIAKRSLLPPFPGSWGSPPPEVPGCGNGLFSTLYSDIGEFYGTAGPTGNHDGWVIRDPVSTILQVPPSMPEVKYHDPATKWLDEQALADLWAADAKLVRADITSATSDKTLFTFLPDDGVAMFQVKRTEYYLPGQTYTKPTKWGVSINPPHEDNPNPSPTWATWMLDVGAQPPTLIVTRLRATKEAFSTLVAAILTVARECGMERVEMWNLPAELLNKHPAETGPRDDHLNAFKWYGREKPDDLEWLFNEKFCWC